MHAWVLTAAAAHAARRLEGDLKGIFSDRLQALLAYGHWVVPAGVSADDVPLDPQDPVHTLALVSGLQYADLQACADASDSWEAHGLAMPLLLSRDEFIASLDAFPLEFGDILYRHVLLAGANPFAAVSVRSEDFRRACEVQARSHLIHLREGFLEANGSPHGVADLIRDSIPSFALLLASLARLNQADHDTIEDLARHAETRLGLSGALVRRLLLQHGPFAPDDAAQLYPPYHEASARLASSVDRWHESRPS
jgi:hypothetical protein